MKKISVTIFCILLFVYGQTQIILENTYINDTLGDYDYLFAVQLEVSGTKYVRLNMNSNNMKLYNLDHSLYKIIPMSVVSPNSNLVFYVSEHLFDLDDGVEYLFLSGNLPAFIKVMDEDGSVLWSESECNPPCYMVGGGITREVAPIANTDSGAKMIVYVKNSNGNLAKAKLYSLPGTLSTEMSQVNGELMKNSGQFSNLYPNPGNGAVTLQYQLPRGEQEGEIILYNTQGAEVKRYKVDGTFKDVIIDNSHLPAGTYFYQLQTGKGVVGTKKMIRTK